MNSEYHQGETSRISDRHTAATASQARGRRCSSAPLVVELIVWVKLSGAWGELSLGSMVMAAAHTSYTIWCMGLIVCSSRPWVAHRQGKLTLLVPVWKNCVTPCLIAHPSSSFAF